jgi:aminopeptidase N
MSLTVDVSKMTAMARLTLLPAPMDSASFDVGALTIVDVRQDGASIPWRKEGPALHVWAPSPQQPVDIEVHYGFAVSDNGWLASGATRTWPYYCGNLFPCRPDPSRALHFEVDVVGELPDGWSAVHPRGLVGPVPAYAAAWAVGPYEYIALGSTSSGTRVGVWHLPGHSEAAAVGTRSLVSAFAWLEKTLGRYPYGNHVGAVEVVWSHDAYGAIEHQPYWHVESSSFGNGVTHVHEAAHGWFGTAVRLRCWEDIVLSEGVASYLAARAVAAVEGPDVEAEVWERYRKRLDYAWTHEDRMAWPEGCGAVDVLRDGLFGESPYMKGAFFLRAVERLVGREALDRALGTFVRQWRGGAAGVADLLAVIEQETGEDVRPLADAWLRSLGRGDLSP